MLILNEYGIGHVCQEWDIPNSWQRGGRKEPFCKQQGLCYRPAELKKLRKHLHLAKPAWKQAADKVSLQVGVLKSRQEVSQDLPLTKTQRSEKELATINTGPCTWHAQNGAPKHMQDFSVLLPGHIKSAKSISTCSKSPTWNYRGTWNTGRRILYILYISFHYTHFSQHTVYYMRWHPSVQIFYPSPKISIFPY